MKIKKIVSDTLKWWYIYVLSFCFLEIVNYGVVQIFVPETVCFWISAFLVLLFSGYLCLTICVVYDKLRKTFSEKENELNRTIGDLKDHIDALDNENKELSKELAKALNDDIRTIQSDLASNKDYIVEEVHDAGCGLKELIHESSNALLDKANNLMDSQNKSTEKIIKNQKAIAIESAELLKEKVCAITEHNNTLTKDLSNEFKTENRKNVDGIIEEYNKASKITMEMIQEKFELAHENSIAHSVEILQKLDNNHMDLKHGIDSIKDDLAKETTKSDAIIELGNTIITTQQHSIGENQRAFVNISESQEKQFTDMKDTVCASIKEASEKASELIQISKGEITKQVAECIKELNDRYLEMKKAYETNNVKVEEKVVALHSKTTKLINTLLDQVEDHSEKHERYISLLGDQISDLAKQNKKSVAGLLHELEKNKEQVAEVLKKLSEYKSEQKKNTEDSEKRIQAYIKALSNYYSKCFDQIDNIQTEILSISHATYLLNSLYSKLQDSIKEKGDKDTPVTKEKSERIEEYKDAESGAIVRNHYKHNKLSYSEMIVSGRKSYDVQYDAEGKASRSRNYNKHGKVVSEIEFYKNGQIKTRTEYLVRDGKEETVVSKFDEKGNKI